jgi:predicted CXXCH cytochrome family protein
VTTDNPRFQNFPHETANTRMLVETGDDLCTNCHPPAVLP